MKRDNHPPNARRSSYDGHLPVAHLRLHEPRDRSFSEADSAWSQQRWGGSSPKSRNGSPRESGPVRPGHELMARKRKRPSIGAIRNGRGVSQHRREHARTLAHSGARRNAPVDFGAINAAALACLSTLVERWLPDGKRVGREWLALNPRRVDRRPGSFKVNLVTGKWADFALDDARGGDSGVTGGVSAGVFSVGSGTVAGHSMLGVES